MYISILKNKIKKWIIDQMYINESLSKDCSINILIVCMYSYTYTLTKHTLQKFHLSMNTDD